MQLALSSLPVRRPQLLIVWAAVAVAWVITILLVAGGGDYIVDHDAMLSDRRFGAGVSLLLFLVSWQLMMVAMMLPSSMPMMVIFRRVSRTHPSPGRSFGVFLLGYFVIWTAFALAALAADAGVHWLTDNVAAVRDRQWLIGGSILVMAGAFQFTSLKEKCLDECRDPVTFFWRHYISGSRSAWNLGLRHGLFCLGCCWALMLTMFAVGMGSLVWMTALTGMMVLEKTTQYGNRLAGPFGVALIIWGVLVILHLEGLPSFIGVL
jgi:predicted metal-binding membrane protein